MTPFIISDAVPEGSLYMLPPDVVQALHEAEVATVRAVTALGLFVFAKVLFPGTWPYIYERLHVRAQWALRRQQVTLARSEEIITKAAKERRIGSIINIGT